MRPALFSIICLLACMPGPGHAQSGRELIEESLQRYAPPAYVYEEHALIMTDRQGQHGVRTARYYARRDESSSRKLHIIDSPAELKGAAIQIQRDAQGTRRGPTGATSVFGTNFLVADVEEERSGDYRYEREGDLDMERVPHFVVRALPADASVVQATGYHERRIYVRKDNLFISRIDYHDREGRQVRRLSYRNPRPDEFGTWRSSMMLMEDLRDGRRTLLKVERRVHSPDYVPASIFEGLQARR